jgi:hypothetical protein
VLSTSSQVGVHQAPSQEVVEVDVLSGFRYATTKKREEGQQIKLKVHKA